MLKEPAFASLLTILTGAFYIILYLLAIISRDAFRFLFNAQFLGGRRCVTLAAATHNGRRRRYPRGDPYFRVDIRVRVGVVV
jgi:hypothetical protein